MLASRAREQRQPNDSARARSAATPSVWNSRYSSRSAGRSSSSNSWSVSVAASVVAVRQLSSCASSSSAGSMPPAPATFSRISAPARQPDGGLRAGQVHLAAQLLAGVEVVQRHLRQRAALDRDDALVAVLLAALIDGERQVAVAQQRLGRGRRDRWPATPQASPRRRMAWPRSSPASVQSASSMETGPSPLACRLNEPRNFSAVDRAGRERERLPDQAGHHRMVVVAASAGRRPAGPAAPAGRAPGGAAGRTA